jgi:plastocyanin
VLAWHHVGRIAAAALAAAAFVLAAADPVLAAEHVVEIRDYKFLPPLLKIAPGDTVRWVNRERRTSHSLLFKAEGLPESARLFPEESWTRRFAAPGAYPYTCGPHPEMNGQIDVAE